MEQKNNVSVSSVERNTNATSEQKKVFISPQEYLEAMWGLCYKIEEQNFEPNLILFPLRGGADIALCLSHQFDDTPMYAIKASFRDWNEFKIPEKVDNILKEKLMEVKGKEIKIQNVLIADDICDSGAVLDKLREMFKEKYNGLNFKFAVAYTKTKSKNKTDFYGKEVRNEQWLVFPYTKEYRKKILQNSRRKSIFDFLKYSDITDIDTFPSCGIL